MINSTDILQLCRLCLVDEKVIHPIFEESEDLRSIFLKITSCLPVSIRKDDSLPKKICDSCSTKLDSYYQFWSESANAEKQLLQWLSQSKTSKQNQGDATTNKKMETEVKTEVDESVDPVDMSTDAQSYILQQQKLAYDSRIADAVNKSESEEPTAKRPRRESAVKALERMESDDEDDADLGTDNYAKTESDESDKEEEEDENNFRENPSGTSVEDQPGPSGLAQQKLVLDDTPIYPTTKIKPCRVVLNNIQHLLDQDGIYIVPGRSRRNLTCYRCFKKFNSAESLEVHKAEHEPESEEEVYAVSDSEIEIESESGDDEKDAVENVNPVVSSPQPNKTVEEIVQKLESPQKQIQVVEPMRPKPTPMVEPVVISKTPIKEPESKEEPVKKVPVLCNIQIRCLTCDTLFTNSELLMRHKPVNEDKPCCFTCKVCSASYSQPEDYVNHIMQHNTFSSSRFGNRGGYRRKPEFRCTYCRKEFEHRFLLKQHEDEHHTSKVVEIVTDSKPVFAAPKPVVVPIPTKVVVDKTPTLLVLQTPVAAVPNPPTIMQIAAPVPIAVKTPTVVVKPPATEAEPTPVIQTTKPKIWVIKEALMKSPEPPEPTVPTVTETSGVKRKLDQMELLNEHATPGKKGRTTRNVPTSSVEYKVVANTSSNMTCDVCFDVFTNKKAFDEHMVFHKDNAMESSDSPAAIMVAEEKVFSCPTCHLHFKSAAGLRRHQTCAHEVKKITSFVCGKCARIFSSRKGLNMHKSKYCDDA